MKKLFSTLMILALSGAVLSSCEDDFDIYTSTDDNTGSGNTGGNGNGNGGGNTGGNGNGLGDQNCYLTTIYVDGDLNMEYFYDSLYTQIDSIHLFGAGGTMPTTQIFNYNNGVLESMNSITVYSQGVTATSSNEYTINADGTVNTMVTNMDMMGTTSVLNSNYSYDASEACGMTGMTGTSESMGTTSNISYEIEYLDANCSFEMKMFQNGLLEAQSDFTFEEVIGNPISIGLPTDNLFLALDGSMPTAITTISDDGQGNMNSVDMDMAYTYNADGNIDQMTNDITTDGQTMTQISTYNYVCP